jgi:uncharacterized protein YndB with AHSA1/START domain
MMSKPPETLKITTPTDRDVVITRSFDAPRDMVYECYTKPELVKRWLGVHAGFTLAVCDIDLRVGGKYRWVWRGPGGFEMGMGGVYKEIKAPERIVSTEKFDQSWYPGDGALSTLSLIERDGRTTSTMTVTYESKEARDIVLKSPMDQGMEAGYKELEKVLQDLQSAQSAQPAQPEKAVGAKS